MASGRKDHLLGKLRSGKELSRREQLTLVALLSLPAIFAQLSMVLMSYIDSAMVGRLGSAQAAAVGLVSSSTWILGGFCYANNSGFSVQIAHRCGAGDFTGARAVFRQGMLSVLAMSVLLALVGLALSTPLPGILGGSEDITGDATSYFMVYSAFLPLFQMAIFAEASLIASGDIKVPSIMSIVMCGLDVVFNYLFIYMMGLGVTGAALGTGLATSVSAGFLLWYACTRSKELRLVYGGTTAQDRQGEADGQGHAEVSGQQPAPSARRPWLRGFIPGRDVLGHAWHITWPLWLQNIITRGAYIAATVLIAPLGTIAIAANSFAITAEGFCYMPGYGIQDAATTLVGQSLGARRQDIARRFSWITIGSAALVMGALAILMYAFAPGIMALLTPDTEVITLGAKCLRIEAFAEIFFAMSIVGYGCCVGAGDTLVPSVINLVGMWLIRIGLAVVLIPAYGLVGYWIAMATELTVKGIIFVVRIRGNRWLNTKLVASDRPLL